MEKCDNNGMMEKPLSIKREDFIKALIMLINECGLPPFVVLDVVQKMTSEIERLTAQHLESDRKAWEESLKTEVEDNG